MKDVYLCEKCSYRTQRHNNYKRHLVSVRHMNNTNENTNNENKNTKINNYTEIKDVIISTLMTQFGSIQDDFDTMQNEIISLKETINNKQVGDNIISHSYNTNIHNTFNLQFFLNDTCKDAMNISDFTETIEVGIIELKNLGKKGYVDAISSLIIDNLNKLDVKRRPMHCSDVKRENIYIRNNNIWEKEKENKKNTQELIREVQRETTRALQNKYQEEYPKCMTDYNSKEHKEYGEIVYEAFGGKGDCDVLNKKIIKKIAKEIAINK